MLLGIFQVQTSRLGQGRNAPQFAAMRRSAGALACAGDGRHGRAGAHARLWNFRRKKDHAPAVRHGQAPFLRRLAGLLLQHCVLDQPLCEEGVWQARPGGEEEMRRQGGLILRAKAVVV